MNEVGRLGVWHATRAIRSERMTQSFNIFVGSWCSGLCVLPFKSETGGLESYFFGFVQKGGEK